MKVYLFGWPGSLGGASTKFAHLIGLLRRRFPVTVVALEAEQTRDRSWVDWLNEENVPWRHIDDLPKRLRGWGVTLCNADFIGSRQWVEMRRRGLKMAWGNEMMWTLPRETGAITFGQVDAVLYVSPVQRAALELHYQRMLRGDLAPSPMTLKSRRLAGWIEGNTSDQHLRWVMVGNYIDPSQFPFVERQSGKRSGLVVGRLSRPDPGKFPVDFPESYENLGLRKPSFRVMAWSPQLEARWPGHEFDSRWELLRFTPDAAGFLQTLDLFVYELGPGCRESWGRAVVEAMLSGAIPLVPRGGGHHLENLIKHGHSGFLCRSREDFRRYARYLQDHPAIRSRISRQCREWAVRRLCNVSRHLRAWERLFHGC